MNIHEKQICENFVLAKKLREVTKNDFKAAFLMLKDEENVGERGHQSQMPRTK